MMTVLLEREIMRKRQWARVSFSAKAEIETVQKSAEEKKESA